MLFNHILHLGAVTKRVGAGRSTLAIGSNERGTSRLRLDLGLVVLTGVIRPGQRWRHWWWLGRILPGGLFAPLLQFLLGLLFLVAGAACQGLWQRRGGWGFMRERSRVYTEVGRQMGLGR